MNESTRRNNRRRRAKEARQDMALLEIIRFPFECEENFATLGPETSSINEAFLLPQAEIDFNEATDSAVESFFADVSPVKDLSAYLSDSSEDETECEAEKVKLNLCKVFTHHNVKSRVVNGILKTLKTHPCFEDFPSDSRSLLGTPRQTCVQNMGTGKYVHFNLRNQLHREIKKLKAPTESVALQVFIDGIPTSNSTTGQFWAILACIGSSGMPFPVGIYYGEHKPENTNEFLKQTVDDIEELTTTGIQLEDRTIAVTLECFICDAPARSFVTYTKGHCGYFPCIRCNVKGESYHSRTVFTELTSVPRTDETFRRQSNSQHHHGRSELERLQIDMVKSFPGEYMHLICLGIMKKLIRLWIRGPRNYFRMSAGMIEQISDNLKIQKMNIPCEFQRKPRSIEQVDRWKATECRQFLLYTGPVVLRKKLPSDYYLHFLCLHVAIRLLVKPTLTSGDIQYSDDLLRYFVQHFPRLYGRENMSFNVHGLLHLAEDARNFGPLDRFGGFKFENYLGKMIDLLRSHSNLLQQVHNRMTELQKFEDTNESRASTFPKFMKEHFDGPCLYRCFLKFQYRACDFGSFLLSTKSPENVCMNRDGVIIMIKNFGIDSGGNYYVVGYESEKPKKFFSSPCSSAVVDCFLVDSFKPVLKQWNLSDVDAKCVRLNYKNSFVIMPLIHRSENV